MGTVYRKTYTKSLPADAETFTWKGEQVLRFHVADGLRYTLVQRLGERQGSGFNLQPWRP